MKLYHDSRSLDCRAPFGAVKCGDVVRLRVYCCGAPRAVSITLSHDGRTQVFPLQSVGNDAYELRLNMPESPCLVWYHFSAVAADGHIEYLGNARDGLGGVGDAYDMVPPPFQITVYSRDYDTPHYLRDGIMYQIFPDRFCRSRAPWYTREDIYLHENWEEPPLAIFDPRNGDTHSRDFFGGDLKGIISKLDYLQSLHVTVLYLNPIFQARSNHRYDTGDYTRVDPMLGDEEDLKVLCAEAAKRGIRVLLDGVFSHTGDDSLYFNKYGRYPTLGAAQSQDSPYYPWYTFERYPDKYRCWWGINTLPEVKKDNEDYRRFMFQEEGVVRRWVRRGTSGWRLDVADELTMRFLRSLRQSVKAENPDATVLGEVWEDASNKVSYGEMRCYCLGDTLDSVMNYPLREAAIAFVRGDIDAYAFVRRIESLRENYPLPFFYSLMNLMGSHDRARVLNMLAGETWEEVDPLCRGECALDAGLRALAVKRLAQMLRLFMAMPGIPCIYYGDEAGMEGAADPFCRGTFPWGREDPEIMALTRAALDLRAARPVLRRGAFEIHALDRDTVRIRRFAYAGCDAFGEPLDDADCEVTVHSVRA